MDKTALRMAESNLLRAEAALERYQAVRLRDQSGSDDYLVRDPEVNALHANIAEAKADLLEAQADWVLHSHSSEEDAK